MIQGEPSPIPALLKLSRSFYDVLISQCAKIYRLLQHLLALSERVYTLCVGLNDFGS